jgi:hypothetical protein
MFSALRYDDDDDEVITPPPQKSKSIQAAAPAIVSAPAVVADDDDGWHESKKTTRTKSHVSAPVTGGGGAGSEVPIEGSPDDMSPSMYNHETPIKTGPWIMYFHDVKDDWTIESTYQIIDKVRTYGQFWALIDRLSDEALANGHFFMMREKYKPMWEKSENINGGIYSMMINDRTVVSDIYQKYIAAAMLDQVATDEGNKITGISISSKKGFNLINVWNEKADSYCDPSNINLLHPSQKISDVRYTRNASKEFDKGAKFEKAPSSRR